MEEIFKGISLENRSINPRASLARAAFKRDFLDNHGGRRSIARIKESFKGKYSTCKTSAGVNPASIFQRNLFKNFFHSIFFSGKSLVKNSKHTFNFTWKSSIKNFLNFLQGNPFTIFQKKKKPEILPQIYREIPLQNFYKEKSL